MKKATPEEVNRAVALDLRSRQISQQDAGKTIGKSRTQVSNQLCSNYYFSKAMAELFARAFGYNIQYLLYGEGELKTEETLHAVLPALTSGNDHVEDVSVLTSLISIADDIIYRTGNEEALKAWRAILEGDFNVFIENIEHISGRHYLPHYNAILARYVSSRIDKTNFVVIREKTK